MRTLRAQSRVNLRPFSLRGGNPKLVRTRQGEGRGPCGSSPGGGSRERPARDLVAPPPVPPPPGLLLQRQTLSGFGGCGGPAPAASAPATFGAPRPRSAEPPILVA